MDNLELFIYEDAIKNDDVEALKKLEIHPSIATHLLSCIIYNYTYSFECIKYMIRNFKISGKYVVDFHTSRLFHKGDHCAKRLSIIKFLVHNGYKIENANLQSAIVMGTNKRVIEYIFGLPDKIWACYENCRIPFLLHCIIHRDNPIFFEKILKKFIKLRDPEDVKNELNKRTYLTNMFPLQTIATDYHHMHSRVESVPFNRMPIVFRVARMIMDYGADPFYSKSILSDHAKMNPQLHDFMESYSQQKTSRQMIHDLLKISKKKEIDLPFNVIIHISTSHMRYGNTYTKKYIDRLYTRYYSI